MQAALVITILRRSPEAPLINLIQPRETVPRLSVPICARDSGLNSLVYREQANLIGEVRLELTTSWSQTKRSSQTEPLPVLQSINCRQNVPSLI